MACDPFPLVALGFDYDGLKLKPAEAGLIAR